jgi:hypothetical protein
MSSAAATGFPAQNTPLNRASGSWPGLRSLSGHISDAGIDPAFLKPARLPNKLIPVEEMSLALTESHQNGLGYYLPTTDRLILVPEPIIRTDARGRLHSLEQAAVEWPSWGEKFYFIHGVRYDKSIWTEVSRGRLSTTDVLELRNIEQRTAALQLQPPERLLNYANARLLSRQQGYVLYRVDDVFRQPAYSLKYTCPSTGKSYVSGVPPEIGASRSALKAIKWKFHLEEYHGRALFTAES